MAIAELVRGRSEYSDGLKWKGGAKALRACNRNTGENMVPSPNTTACSILSGTFGFGLAPFLVTPLVAYVYALWVDATDHELGQLALDALLPPLGMIHGIMLLFA
jgi:hypothetical protein